MTNNSGSSMEYQPFTAQAWQAGAQPWKVDGENITIDMTKDSGMKKYIEFQQKLIDEDSSTPRSPTGPTTGIVRSTKATSPLSPSAHGCRLTS